MFPVWVMVSQRFSSITEGIETPSKNMNPMTSFSNCLAKERLLRAIKVLVTLQVTTVVPLKPVVYYSILRMRTWQCQNVRAQLPSHCFSFPLSTADFLNSASDFQPHLQCAVKSGMKKLEERLPWADFSGPEMWDNCGIQDPLGSALTSLEWYVLRV